MTTPFVLFPDATRIVADRLRALLEPTPVVTRVPKPRPDRFVLVRRLGGARANLVVDDAQLGIECWDDTDAEAHDLAQLARAHVNAMAGTVAGGVRVYAVREFAGPADLPDPLSNQPRYVFTSQVAVRGTGAEATGGGATWSTITGTWAEQTATWASV